MYNYNNIKVPIISKIFGKMSCNEYCKFKNNKKIYITIKNVM